MTRVCIIGKRQCDQMPFRGEAKATSFIDIDVIIQIKRDPADLLKLQIRFSNDTGIKGLIYQALGMLEKMAHPRARAVGAANARAWPLQLMSTERAISLIFHFLDLNVFS